MKINVKTFSKVLKVLESEKMLKNMGSIDQNDVFLKALSAS